MPVTIYCDQSEDTVHVNTDDPNTYVPANQLLPYLCKYQKIVYNGELINGDSDLFRLFVEKGIKCVCCGCVGEVFQLRHDRKTKHPFITLYALLPTKWKNSFKKVPMTKDHILPKSFNGQDIMDNYQTMCSKCNNKKGNSLRDVKPDW